MSWDETKKDRSGGCHFTPCPKNCLSCPYPECINNRPPVRGEDGVDRYVNLTDGTKEKNIMQTKYSVGDTVLVDAKVVRIEADKKGVKYILSSDYWTGQNCVREEKIISKMSRKTPKVLEKAGKASSKRQKASTKQQKTTKTAENGKELQKNEESKEKQQGSTEGVKAAQRQQERKRPGRPGKNAVEDPDLSALARELADSV